MSTNDMLGDTGIETEDVNLFPRITNVMQEDAPPGFNLPDDLIPRLDAIFEEQEDIDAEDMLLRLGRSGEPPFGERDFQRLKEEVEARRDAAEE